MRCTLCFLTLLVIVAVVTEPAKAGRPVYAVLEHKEVTITSINTKAKSILFKLPGKDGTHGLSVVPKTWILKDGDAASFEDLRVGQHLQVRYIPRTSQAVTLEVLPTKSEK